VGYLPEERGLYKKMKVWDILLFFAELKGKKGKEIQKRASEYLKRFELFDRRFSKIEDLSKGNQQKVQFIATILHDPEFLVLDEPFSGLDPINTDLLREIILEEKEKGKVIIFSTHLMDYAEKMVDYLAMIDNGEIILEGSLGEIKKKFSRKNITIDFEGDISFLHNNPIVEKITDFGNTTGIRVREENQAQELLKLLIEHNVKIKRFDAQDISLHEIFLELAGSEKKEVENVQ
jgi:ABC-2 type transport system ATP-binding protein